MTHERRVRLFRHGRNQAIRIPCAFEQPGEDVVIRKEVDRLIIEPVKRKSLIEYLDSLEPLDEEFPPIADPPSDEVDI